MYWSAPKPIPYDHINQFGSIVILDLTIIPICFDFLKKFIVNVIPYFQHTFTWATLTISFNFQNYFRNDSQIDKNMLRQNSLSINILGFIIWSQKSTNTKNRSFESFDDSRPPVAPISASIDMEVLLIRQVRYEKWYPLCGQWCQFNSCPTLWFSTKSLWF